MYLPPKASPQQLHQAQQKQVWRNCQEIVKAWPQQEVRQRDWIKRLPFCASGRLSRGSENAALLLTSFMTEQSTLANNTKALPSLTTNAQRNRLPANKKTKP